jgi:pimeloyl-ACP methyl ester carboxylesterase
MLGSTRSDWDELDTVVNYIRRIRRVKKVHLIAWSQGSARIGPYSVQHPDKVASLFFFASIFNPAAPAGAGPDGFTPPVPLPRPGTPMTIRTRADIQALWDGEQTCEGQREDGIEEIVWDAIMDNDDIGSTWGRPLPGAPANSPADGVMRVRSPYLFGWNLSSASRITVPSLIIRGEFDKGDGGMQKLEELYDAIQNPNKLRFVAACAGHRMNWESQRRILQHISKKWLTRGNIQGFTTGEFFIDREGALTPLP